MDFSAFACRFKTTQLSKFKFRRYRQFDGFNLNVFWRNSTFHTDTLNSRFWHFKRWHLSFINWWLGLLIIVVILHIQRSIESTLKRKPSRYFGDTSFFYDDIPPLDDLSSDKLTPPILSEWIRAKGESFGSVYLVRSNHNRMSYCYLYFNSSSEPRKRAQS